ncbi:transferrin [Anopheles stephensi]|uniref:transferrin n=1 Tax=Anopheles stephensi TaxID=30069 RepID=UPI001658A7A1|nr:transferrin [Anopheles stephensi]
MKSYILLWIVPLVASVLGGSLSKVETYRWCVPLELLDDCARLTRAAVTELECVGGIDRLDCLRKVQNREADFLLADPEDVYVASHFNNQDFVVFSELRTAEEPTAKFRYEGIMLVRASDNFQSLADLRGKRSCHTGFGRNVGYKIPVTRLQRAGVLKLPAADGSLSPVERELAGLSDLFSASCLPGSYSSDAGVDRLLKGRYANLCERCDQPQRCAKDDRFAGYEGAIRCLVENGGDVAFSKTIYVRKYFGLPVTPGGAPAPALNPNARTEDYAYLCEDGTTRPIADGQPVCSWAQRPWQVLLGNGDLNGQPRKLQTLFQQLYRYWTDANNQISDADRTTAQRLWIEKKAPIVDRQDTVAPREYLAQANYAEVIERERRFGNKLRLCVISEDERQKCELMRQAAYSRDIRPALECVLKTVDACVAAVNDGSDADVVVLKQPNVQLKPLMWETYGDVMVAIADKTITRERLQTGPVALDTSNGQAVAAARVLSAKLPSLQTVDVSSPNSASAPVRIVRSKTLAGMANNVEKVLVCPDLSFQPLSNAANCHLESSVNSERNAGAVYVRKDVDEALQDSIVHAFTALSDTFGRGQPREQVFRMFGPYRLRDGTVKHHLIFNDYASVLTVNK